MTGYTSVLIVTTVVVAPAVVLALAKTGLVANAIDVIHPYRPGTGTEIGIAGGGRKKEIKKRPHTGIANFKNKEDGQVNNLSG